MSTLYSLLLNRSFLRTLILVTSGLCLYFAYRDYLQFTACWECFSAGKHNEDLELRQDSIASILVAVGVLFESFELLAKRAGSRRPDLPPLLIHATAEACAVKGAFVVVVGLIIEMVNQVSKTLDGNHALIHMVKSLINLPLILLALVLLLAAFRDLFRSPVSHE
jgi:hypothetical protein